MRRRDFIKGVAGSATALPLAARAQQLISTIRRIGIIIPESVPTAEALGCWTRFVRG